jgi:hypothetical protein
MKLFNKPILVFLLLIPVFSNAQVLVNYGSSIVIDENANIVIAGEYQNHLDGNIENSGHVYITGDWVNKANAGALLQNTSGTVTFFGDETQHISGTQKTHFNKIDLKNHVELETTTSVSSALFLSSAKLNLLASDLVMYTGSVITGNSGQAYLITEGVGQLKQVVGNSEVEFPVGTISSYVPVILNNAGEIDTFGVNVFQDVLELGLSGATISSIHNCVNNSWNITEEINGGSDVSISVSWDESLEGSNFDRNNCGLGHFTAGAWNPQSGFAASGSNPYSVTRLGITSLSAFAVGDTISPMAISLKLTVDISVFLEGPFSETEMSSNLNPDNIPTSQPYHAAPWNYSGTESVEEIPNANVVDWVLLELRDATEAPLATGETMVARQAAFLLNDGSVVSLDGSSNPYFTGTNIFSNLFVVVWHRNHLGIMSAFPLTATGGMYSYDFTNEIDQAYNSGQKNLGGGYYGMISADALPDGTVNFLDKSVWQDQAGSGGYHSADLNLDGQVNNPDKNDQWNENKGASSSVPQ